MKRVMWTIKHRMLKKISQFVLAYQKTAQEAVKIADQLYVTSPDDWATSIMRKAQARLETDEND